MADGARSGLVMQVSRTEGLDNYVLDKNVGGFLRFDQKYVDGDLIRYIAYNTRDVEEVEGTFNVGANTLTRDTLLSSTTGAFVDWESGQRIIQPLVSGTDTQRIILLGTFERGAPDGGAITRFDVTDAGSFPANFVGSDAKARSGATTDAVGTINLVSGGITTQFGTFTFAAGNDFAIFTTVGSVMKAFAADDIIELVWPSPGDATLADIALTLRANRT